MSVPFPRTGRPALNALAAAGYDHLGQLDGVRMREVLALHGMGPKGIGALRRAMAEHGWAFADDDPRVGATTSGLVSVEPGLKPDRNANATAPTEVVPGDWVETLPKPRQREQGRAMLDLFGEVTGEQPVMWGPSIIGYGQLHYVYESGREGDMPRVAFSPRSAALTLYVLGAPQTEALLARLGRHRRTVSCLYVNNLDDIDLGVLRELIAAAWQHEPGSSPPPTGT